MQGKFTRDDAIPPGLCQCGCGAATGVRYKCKGKPFARYLIGHHHRKTADRIRIDIQTGCHVWQGASSPLGYGNMTVNGKSVSAHRHYYEQKNGPIAKGLHLDHLCRNPSCVNPDHLEAVTPTENMRRGINTQLVQQDVDEIRASSASHIEIALRFGISPSHVCGIRKGKCWK